MLPLCSRMQKTRGTHASCEPALLPSFTTLVPQPLCFFQSLQVNSAEEKRAELLQSADVRCLDAAAKFAGLMGPLQLVQQGMGMVSALLHCSGMLLLVT